MNVTAQTGVPYPNLACVSKDKRAGKLLLKCYCGTCSELTQANQYLYHYISTAGENAAISEALFKIASVEQQHLYLLGNAVRKLGVNPKYRTVNDDGAHYWTSRNIKYGKQLKDMLLYDIESEKLMIKQYHKLINCIDNMQIQALLNRICDDEKLHVKILTDLYKMYF